MTLDAWPIYIVPSAALPSVCATEPIYIWQRNECTVVRVRCVLQSRYTSDTATYAVHESAS